MYEDFQNKIWNEIKSNSQKFFFYLFTEIIYLNTLLKRKINLEY